LVIPSLLITIDTKGWITIAIIGNESIGSYSGNSFDQFADAIETVVPFRVELLIVDLQPGFESRQTADDFLLADFHRPANRPFAWRGIHQRGFDQILASQKETAALRPTQALATGKTVKV